MRGCVFNSKRDAEKPGYGEFYVTCRQDSYLLDTEEKLEWANTTSANFNLSRKKFKLGDDCFFMPAKVKAD